MSVSAEGVSYMKPPARITVCISVNPEWGGVMPTFPLARALREAGHRVIYAGPPPCAFLLEGRKVPWHDIIGCIEDAGYEFYQVAHGLVAASADCDALTAMECAYTDAVSDCAALVREQAVDLLLLDPFIWFAAIGAARQGVPVLSIKTNLRARLNAHVPPSTSHFVPDGSLASRLRILGAWLAIFAQWNLLSWFHPPSRRLLRFVRKTGRDGRRVGLRLAVSDFHPEFVLPEVTLCPRSFDFAPVPGRVYVGMVDEARGAEPFSWPAGPGSRRVYCTAGTMTSEFEDYTRRFVDACVGAAALDPELSMVVQVPRGFWPAARVPDNVALREWVPQCSALNAADLAVVAGGLGTIKECILAGTPPVVVSPRHADKPGNAARVAYHELGARVSAAELSPRRLARAIDQVWASRDRHRANMAVIQHEMRDPAGARRFVEVVERMARDHGDRHRAAHARGAPPEPVQRTRRSWPTDSPGDGSAGREPRAARP
jgi:zeaxanthin glucosyltransferase